MKQLKVFASLGSTHSVGWERDDLPMVHVFGNAEPGARFKPSNGRGGPHWPCPVCQAHGYTEADFHRQLKALASRAQA